MDFFCYTCPVWEGKKLSLHSKYLFHIFKQITLLHSPLEFYILFYLKRKHPIRHKKWIHLDRIMRRGLAQEILDHHPEAGLPHFPLTSLTSLALDNSGTDFVR